MSLSDGDKEWISSMMDARLAGVEQRMDRIEERIYQRIERVETSLLTEFHKWASPLEMRMRSHSAAMRALDLEVEKP